ncbi:MAG: hypothetical protein IT335_03275 [Thermomicrobiales bacterium]|nr:hypothetical protein [Thermomicrobiales bacterium]
MTQHTPPVTMVPFARGVSPQPVAALQVGSRHGLLAVHSMFSATPHTPEPGHTPTSK